MSGFPAKIFEGSGRGEQRDSVTTRLFPNMKFGCVGTIVGFTAAVLNDSGSQSQQPLKIQVWRKSESQPGLFFKIYPDDIQIWNRSNHPCHLNTSSNKTFQCTLREDLRISVQPGDILGLEIPPINKNDFEIYFKAGGPTNLVFHGQLESTVDLSTEPYNITNDEPQITFLVVLGTLTPCI